MAILIKGGMLVTAEESFPAGILIEGERILQIGQDLQVAGSQRSWMPPAS